jgi:hypothetical protein
MGAPLLSVMHTVARGVTGLRSGPCPIKRDRHLSSVWIGELGTTRARATSRPDVSGKACKALLLGRRLAKSLVGHHPRRQPLFLDCIHRLPRWM